MKATDQQIMLTILNLDSKRESYWYNRFGEPYRGISGHRREKIQERLAVLHRVHYSDGGIRSRLKGMVDKGLLRKELLEEDQPYYGVNEHPES